MPVLRCEQECTCVRFTFCVHVHIPVLMYGSSKRTMTNKRRRLFGRIKLPVRGRVKRRHEHQKYYIIIMTFSYAPVKWDTDKYWRCFCGYQNEIRLAIHTIIGLSYMSFRYYRKRTVRRNILRVRSDISCKLIFQQLCRMRV